MKKVLSLILTLCMFGTFAICASAAATDTTSHKLNIVETETGATVEYILSGEYVNFSAIKCIVTYDSAKVSYDSIAYEAIDGWKGNMTASAAGYLIFTNGEGKGDSSKYITGSNQKVATITFNKVGDVSLSASDITITATKKVGRTSHKITTAISGAAYDTGITIADSSFTPYVPAGKDPVITVDESAKTGANNGVIDVVTGTEGNYSVTVKAPIGKTPVLVVGGTNIPMTSVGGADYSYAGQVSADATIKVIYEDVAATVITYPIVYQDANCAVVFGKGTIGEGDKYGIKVTDTTGKSKDCEAKNNVGGIFGVRFNYVNAGGHTATNGTYKAQAFVGSEYGEEITFTK